MGFQKYFYILKNEFRNSTRCSRFFV